MKQMKKEYKRRFPGLSVAALRSKLISTVALLLVASSLLVTSSYAWFVLSTAPEVTGIQTQVGANGSLEVALLNQASWDDLTLLDMGDIDESADATLASDNLTWGNLVNLSDSRYGLSQITLNPARLFIEESGTDTDGRVQYSVNDTILKTPIYGEDGRVKRLDKESAVAYVYENNVFGTEGKGVRAIGTAASMNEFARGMMSARSNLGTYMSSARTVASTVLNQQGGALADMVVRYALTNQTTGYTVSDVEAVKELALGLQNSLNEIETALRYAFAGYLATADANVESFDVALGSAMNPDTSLSSLLEAYPGVTGVLPGIDTYITKVQSDMSTVSGSINTCNTMINGGGTFNWEQITAAVYPLMDTDSMLLSGMTIDELKDYVMPGGEVDYGKAFALVSGEGVTISVPTGSGVLSDIADFAGNYTARVTIENFTYGGFGPMSVDVNMTTATTYNPTHLSSCSVMLSHAETNGNAAGVSAISDFYGYAVDLAFRTNAEESNLLLQTEPENRVYEGSEENALLQGGGSYMTFTTQAGLSATKMVRLMQGIRVVLMDENQDILAIAALDCRLGQDSYVVMTDEEKVATGKYAYLDGSADGAQISDQIDYAAWLALPMTSSVVFDKQAGTVSAKLYLYEFAMALNEAGNKTGGLRLGDKAETAVITPLEQDTVQRVTAVVYIDGSYVTNATVAANAAQSMTGTLNLQFSSDAVLMPSEITALRSGSDVTKIDLAAGADQALDSGAPTGAEVTWSSNAASVATVSDGVVHGMAAGRALITASWDAGGEGDDAWAGGVKYFDVTVSAAANEEP